MAFTISDKTRAILKPLAAMLLLLAIGLGMLCMSWRKWPDILIDFGWELYASWQLSSGAVLYKDICSAFGPLSFWINEVTFRMFGASLMSVVYLNITLLVILTYVIYRFFCLVADWATATTAAAVFLSMFAFAQYVGVGNYNFVCPYSHQMTHAVVISFIAIYVFARWIGNHRNGLLFLTGFLAGLVFLAKSEVFIALIAAVSAGYVVTAFVNRFSIKRMFATVLGSLAAFLLPVACAVVLLWRGIPLGDAVASILAAYRYMLVSSIGSNIFYRGIMGLDRPLYNLGYMFVTAGCYFAVVLFFALVRFLMKLVENKGLKMILNVAIPMIVCMSVFLVGSRIQWFQLFRGLPLAMILTGTWFFVSIFINRKNMQECNRWIAPLTFFVFSFMMLAKMILNTHIYHYGFALALPATLLLCAVFAYYAPKHLGRTSREVSLMLRVLGIMIIAVTIAVYVYRSTRLYAIKTLKVGSGGDTIVTYDPQVNVQGLYLRAALTEIERHIGKDETFLVLPEGIMLNYLSRRRNPFPYVHFMPFELTTIGETRILAALRDADPDFIILLDRDVSEYGFGDFGTGYGIETYEWIKDNYAPVSLVGNRPLCGQGFGVLITKRVEQPPRDAANHTHAWEELSAVTHAISSKTLREWPCGWFSICRKSGRRDAAGIYTGS